MTISEEDVKKHIQNIMDKGNSFEKKRVYDIIMSEVFKTVTSDEMLRSFNRLPKTEKLEILLGIEDVSTSKAFLFLLERTEQIIYNNMYNKSTDKETFTYNKMCLWTVSQIRSLTKSLVNTAKVHKNNSKSQK